jgi:hypothetical protein
MKKCEKSGIKLGNWIIGDVRFVDLWPYWPRQEEINLLLSKTVELLQTINDVVSVRHSITKSSLVGLKVAESIENTEK